MTKRYAQTQDEMAGLLGISGRQFRTYTSRPDAPSKTKSGYNIAQWTAYYRQVKSEGLKGDGSLKDEKLLREIERLDIKIGEERGELVNRKEEEDGYRRELANMRKVIDDWEAHETAKHPEHAERITELSTRLIEQIKERAGQ